MGIRNRALTIGFLVWDRVTQAGETGDAANLTLLVIRDGVPLSPAAPNITEVDPVGAPGEYLADLSATENDGLVMGLAGVSTTLDAFVVPTRWHNVEPEAGTGGHEFVYTLLELGSGDPIADAFVWVTSDLDGSNVLASGRTDEDGNVTFFLDLGATVYIWRRKSGWVFDDPDVEEVD